MNGAVILAAGKGSRFNGQKQFILLDGLQLWEHVKNKVLNYIEERNIIVVGVDVNGGETRSESVKIGLDKLDKSVKKVIILEAARPLVTKNQIKELLDDPSPSSTFVRPLVNTIIGRNGVYHDRNDFYNLLTPQAFDFNLLLKAYKEENQPDYTDETILMYKKYRIKPNMILTSDNLIKVTYPSDIYIIKKLYNKEIK